MNSDPPGTDEDIAAQEDVIDIFVLCGNSTDALQLERQLAPMGYRVTLFSGTESLFENLRAGLPNLLICDTTGPGQDGYEVCRQIKADDELWRIPVLLVTGTGSLGDLLSVLDSNADNFIARPCDPQYLYAVIDALLAAPVEKPDPEKIKTQFKIRHEEREYVITADRRKLLEFVLSSFEIAISRAAEQARGQQELDALAAELEQKVAERTAGLSSEVSRLEMMVKEHSRALSLTESALQEQKKEVMDVRGQLEDREWAINADNVEIARLTQDLESTRSRLTEAEGAMRTLTTEKDELEHALRGDAEALNRDLEQTRAELESVRHQLHDEIERRTSLDVRCGDLAREREQTGKELVARVAELEGIKSALAAEKDRAAVAGEEARSVREEKNRTEQELRQMLHDLTEKANLQAQENLRLTDDLSGEQSRRTDVEHQLEVLRQEMEKKETALVAEKGSIREHRDTLQQKFDALTEAFGAERQKSTSFETEIQGLKATLEKRDGDMRTLIQRLEQANAATEEEKHQRLCAEKTLKESVSAKSDELESLRQAYNKIREELDAQKAEMAVVLRERETAKGSRKNLEDELAAAVLGRAQAEKLARSIAYERDQLREELGNEQRQRTSAEEELNQLKQVKEKIEENLQAVTEAKTTEETSRQSRIQKLKDQLETMLTRQKSLEAMLISAGKEQAEKEAALQALSGELEQAMARVEAETEKRRAAEDELAEVRQSLPQKKPVTTTTIIEEVPVEAQAVIVRETDLPAVVDTEHQVFALSEEIPADLHLIRDEPSAPPEDEMEKVPPVQIRSVEDLYEEPHELDIHDLPDATPAMAAGTEIQTGTHAGPAVKGPDIPAGHGVEKEPLLRGTGDEQSAESLAGAEKSADAGPAAEEEDEDTGTLPEMTGAAPAAGETAFSRQQWFDLVKWAHNTPALSHDDRLRIVRLGRLIQKGRRLTRRQEAQLAELVALARSMGYRSNN